MDPEAAMLSRHHALSSGTDVVHFYHRDAAAPARRALDLRGSYLDGTVTRFFVGRHGNDDGLTLGVLRRREKFLEAKRENG